MIPRLHKLSQPANWRQSLQNAYRKPSDLLHDLGLDGLVTNTNEPSFRMLVPRSYASRIRHGDPNDPLLLQVLPSPDEENPKMGYSHDPVGDQQAGRGSGILHKYHGRVLLITTGACAIHCRYCFRQHFPYSENIAARDQWAGAVAYIKNNEDVSELILSGGDPLLLSTGKLKTLTDRLVTIPHLKRLRVHTRVPVVLPERINENLCGWFESLPFQVVTVIHANHANEFNGDTNQALSMLKQTGSTLLNQAVLLRKINDSGHAISTLSEAAFKQGVLPYYLHLLDRVQGASQFEIGPEKALEIMHEVRLKLPGYLVPKLVSEQAGMPYKTPLM